MCKCSLIILAVAGVGVGAAFGQAGQFAAASDAAITVDYAFDHPEIASVEIAGEMFDRVIMSGVANCGNAGQPALPASGASILLPLGTDVASVEIITGDPVLVATDLRIEPVQQPVPLRPDVPAAGATAPNEAIYASAQPFPAERFESIGVQGFRGYQILTLKLNPVEYIPSTGELFYYPKLTTVVHTTPTGRVSEMLRGLPGDAAAVSTKVDNPVAVASYEAAGIRGARSYSLLIITTDAYASSFTPLKTYHDANGVPTEIRTTTDIGSSNPDNIRAYIQNAYLNDGIDYVIIGGDDDVIPAKDLYVLAYSGGDTETAMPGDVYYACLDGV
ncbi:MAG: hypothetical protein JXO22_08035, partial [Phycisphaerae bacterium]|nr:hypothetical protein [Phycisphaerae bacterium]